MMILAAAELIALSASREASAGRAFMYDLAKAVTVTGTFTPSVAESQASIFLHHFVTCGELL